VAQSFVPGNSGGWDQYKLLPTGQKRASGGRNSFRAPEKVQAYMSSTPKSLIGDTRSFIRYCIWKQLTLSGDLLLPLPHRLTIRCLSCRYTVAATSAFLESFQRLSDFATGSKGNQPYSAVPYFSWW